MAYHQFTITLPDDFREQISSDLWDMGCLGIMETEEDLIAYFPGTAPFDALQSDVRRMIERLSGAGGAGLSSLYALLEDQDWNRTWKAGFVPLDIGARFTVLPPWEEKRSGRTNLVIDPGMAFGTGHHETTRSCLVLIEAYAARTPRSQFLDLGTGTGLLAIAAAHLGFERVIALDNDPLAIDATERNLALNNLDGIEVVAGDLSQVTGTFDLIAANLISGTLVDLAPEIAKHLRPAGFAVLSGILISQENEVIEAMILSGLHHHESLRDGKWISLVITRL